VSYWTLPRETKELVGPITAADGTVPVTTFQVALILDDTRPLETDWQTPTDMAGEKFILVGASPNILTPGTYKVWVRWTAGDEVPVVENAGTVHIL
jgi:hypothetical protein